MSFLSRFKKSLKHKHENKPINQLITINEEQIHHLYSDPFGILANKRGDYDCYPGVEINTLTHDEKILIEDLCNACGFDFDHLISVDIVLRITNLTIYFWLFFDHNDPVELSIHKHEQIKDLWRLGTNIGDKYIYLHKPY